jgi:hypothetical protein
MGQENEIVFEDLHGVNEDEPVTVDLDAATKDVGIQRTPADQAADDDAGDDDGFEFDGLRSANKDDDESPADQSASDDEAASSDSADDDYSKKVKARIERERRATRKARDEAGYWKGQAEKLAKDTSSRDKDNLKRDIEQTDSAIVRTLADLDGAIEGGNTKDQVRLTDELTDLKAKKYTAEVSLTDLPESGNLQPFDGKVAPTTSKDESEADKWMEGRSAWYRADGFERQTVAANRVDKEVFNAGFDPNTPEYFEELDKRLKVTFPDLYDDADTLADDDPPPRKASRTPVTPVGGNDTRRQRTSGSKVELGESDFANMRRFGLDTNDPNVLREYARNKREADQGERR